MTGFTRHAIMRARQRGLREQDIAFVLHHGTDTGDGVILAGRDAQEIIAEAKKIIGMAERLKNVRIVATDHQVITAFHASRDQQHDLLHS